MGITQMLADSASNNWIDWAAAAGTIGAGVAAAFASYVLSSGSRRELQDAAREVTNDAEKNYEAVRQQTESNPEGEVETLRRQIAENRLGRARLEQDRISKQNREIDRARRLWTWMIIVTSVIFLLGAIVVLAGAVAVGIFTAVASVLSGFVGGAAYHRLNKLEDAERERQSLEDQRLERDKGRDDALRLAQALPEQSRNQLTMAIAMSMAFDADLSQLLPLLSSQQHHQSLDQRLQPPQQPTTERQVQAPVLHPNPDFPGQPDSES
ncbi:hypothetical protein H4P1_00044 (plasmid) [Variovorax sp. PBS-H4]|uniref:threonine/serine exporter family protein n=1 Tax=Variovorax sp. PBS-H4 TaxID=434008 RepID=UPI0013163686|nr:threonine/serine exporter family protein [Variovorax sp. PBS-H4]VTU41412.1 hypothetical protein H4P1_00044 [Variovorax sp. PBS-H4]